MLTRRPLTALAAVLIALPIVACDDKESGPDDGDPVDHGVDGEGEAAGPVEPRPAAAVACEGVEPMACGGEADEAGLSHCVIVDGEQVWSACLGEYDAECLPGDGFDQGCLGSICTFDGELFHNYDWEEPDCVTPLVLSFDGAPVRFTAGDAAPVFDFAAATGTCATDWPSAPWLALDRDRDGAVDSGRELFGSGTRLASGRRAAHGFEALAELDADGDRTISVNDPRFSELVLWSDHDGDRAGTPGEQVSLSSVGLVAIHLDFHRRGECDERGNCGRERAAFEFRGPNGEPRVGEVVDVYLACQ
jgi:hypothetical protein